MKSFFPYPLRLLVGLVATAGLVHAQPTPPTMSTLPASPVGATNATLNGTANPDGLAMAGWFEWGATTNYGNITPAQALGSGGSNTNFSRGLASLTPGVAYHFRAVVSNSFYVVSGTNQSFTTLVFTDIGAGLHGMDTSSGVWGDFDNDGRLDFVLSGRGTNIPGPSGFSSGLWKNTGSGFTNSNNLSLTYKGIAWGDYDNDGRLDLLIADRVLRHTGSSFVDIQTGFPQPFFGSTTWGDYDGDGRMDVLVTGLFSYDPGDPFAPVPAEADVWLNRPAGFVRANTGLAGVSGAAAWGDYDSDGRLDVALSGFTNGLNYETLSSRILRNTGAGFSNINAGLPGLFSDSLAWGDYDNDGRPDLLLAGQSATGVVSQVWRNTGNGFSNINAGLPGVYFGSAAWGDYDNDGRLDILLTGATNYVSGTWTGFVSQVWRNTGNGFTNLNAGLPGVYSGSAAWGDYDNDGRLDILLTGTNATLGRISQVWRNHSPATNTPPSAPTGLTVTLAGNNAFFSWNAGTDVQTPAAGLTYNLRVGSTPGGSDLIGPMAGQNGWRRLPQPGNAQQRLFRSIHGLPIGQPIYWSVQAVDTAFAGSLFAAEKGFALNVTPPNGVGVPGDTNGDGSVDQAELNTVLANYFPNSPFLQMTNVAGLGGTNVTFALSNSTAGAFSVEVTTNLVDWNFLGPALPRHLFTDTNAPTNPQRYYRLRWP